MDHPGGEGGYDRVVLFPQASSPMLLVILSTDNWKEVISGMKQAAWLMTTDKNVDVPAVSAYEGGKH
ncbi:hypothetical protein [Halobacillus litoralis]|uniref:hypothetical protein n=1 Tax=Halobacillus litoralis TaxID=45668 RepID=UPI00136E875C|nr:hypothetical protein [Halobacillus litoralis]MYL38240.1 hypothetical protein [Halobacillus litoralis]